MVTFRVKVGLRLGLVIRAGRIKLFTARVLCRASYQVLGRVCIVQPRGGHISEGYCAKSSLSTDARQLR